MVKKSPKKIARAIIKDISAEKKKKKRPSAPRTTISGVSGLSRELACSVVNPFECSACIPDGRTNTGCFSIKSEGQLTVGINGTCCGIAVSPQTGFVNYIMSAGTVATAAIAGSWLNLNGATVTNNFTAVRAVSAGLRLTFAGNTQTDQGTIVAGQLPENITLGSLNGATMQSFANSSADFRIIPLRNGCEVVWRPEAHQDMSTFIQASNAGTGVGFAPNVPIIYAFVFGCFTSATVSTVVCNYEFVCNFEGQFGNQGFIPGGIKSASASPMPMAEPGWYEKVKNVVDRVIPIVPLVGSALTAATGNPFFSTLGSLANGIRYQSTVGRSSRMKI